MIKSKQNFGKLISNISQTLEQSNLVLTTAESCTGGWLAKYCTDKPGSSKWFDCGFITYSNKSKQRLLDVSLSTLEQYGAVSKQVAIEMSQGALLNSNANISVAITGIAGPDGGSIEKPVGTVWLAWSTSKSTTYTEHHLFSGDREMIRQQAVMMALKGIIKNASDPSLSMG